MKLYEKLLNLTDPEREKQRREMRKAIHKREAYVEDLDRTLTGEEMMDFLRDAGVLPPKK